MKHGLRLRLVAFSMLAALAATVAMTSVALAAPATAAAANPSASPATGSVTFPIDVSHTCTAAEALAGSGLCSVAGDVVQYVGTGTVTSFAVGPNHTLTAAGTYTGTLTNTTENISQVVTGSFTNAPVDPNSCQILNLTIGPINLNLLGLVVTTNTIHLNITAQRGPGNLLGNLLCAVANLLNGSSSTTALQQLVSRLNQILGAL